MGEMLRCKARVSCAVLPRGGTQVEDFPAFIVCDDKGNDFFKEFNM